MRHLIINADGYGFTAGISRAIEECVEFGTVRSLSANVNFTHADGLTHLVQKHPGLSVGCHVNPVVGRPVLSPKQVPSLVDENGEFF
jgi:chitin disaccharide deacetylase